MRRMLCCVLTLGLLLMAFPLPSLAQEDYVMAGYDTADSKHVWDDNLFFRRMAELTGIDFTFQQYNDTDEWTKVKAGFTAGGELPDVLFKAELSEAETISLYEKGVLIDLKPYLPTYAPNLWALLQNHPEWERAITLSDGAIVALPTINELPTENAIWINKTWLGRLKLEMPSTVEELTEALRAIKTQDPNRNGRSDEVPLTFTGLWELKFLAHGFGVAPNDYGIEVVDGKVVFQYTTDAYRAFLTWLHDLYTEDLIDHDGFITLDSSRAITDSNATITFGAVYGPTPMTMLPSSVLSDYSVLLLSADGKQVYRQLMGEVTRGTFAVTSACKDPGALLSWVDYLYTTDGCFLAASGREHDEYDVTSDGKWYWLDDVTTVQDSILVDSTISEGAAMPLYMSADYQLSFDDETTSRAVAELYELHKAAKLAYPTISIPAEKKAEIAQIWSELGSWCEVAMTWFVTGDTEINDETWAAFVSEAQARGAEKMAAIFQEALD
ncbi:MAG: extracellular solute-binding protein [Clostridia bacterium]|nr:extracellular solute-binding protein [Clostridia bacterium]